LRLRLRPYLYYKFFNSLFTGLSVGSIFVIYEPLMPSIYSIGGIVLAVGMMIIARFYDILLNIRRYFQIGLLVEVVMLVLVTIFLVRPYTFATALLVYAGYQLTFVFGAYLVRAETLLIKRAVYLSKVDIYKQAGYLAGMVASLIFYQLVDGSKQEQVYRLHYLLLILEVVIITLFVRSFKGSR